ncbi:DUF6350 family protein [Intrasporangium sp.]|uniref:cell division protein PerM n=1 Tax=Intrasporangium sp. TaxID=1925024 RepID=UPI00293B86AB|nr:DUF6350 family protein [Intrasporangium sp.]MDV3222407.1 DUF6350 family protein [Intrasporangium sp.]
MSPLPNPPPAPARARSAAIRTGALAALGTWAIVVLPSLVGWLAAPEGSLGWFSAVQVGTALWFLGHGQSIGGSGVSISLTPIALFLVFAYVSVRWGRRLVTTERAAASRAEWSRVARLGVVPGFLVGYVGAAAVLSLLTLGGPVAPGVAAVPGTALVPIVALGYLLLRPDEPDAPGFVRAGFLRGPSWLPSAWRVGWRGVALLVAVGLAVVFFRIAMSADEVGRIHDDYGLDVAAGAIVVLAQLMLLANAATWAVAFLAGPGFSIAAGSLISPAAAQPGLMPLVPMLGALPAEADYPTAMYAVVLLPVLCGVVIGRWVDRELEFFGNLRARLAATTIAVLIAVSGIGLLTWLGNGAIGVERLSSVGPFVPPVVGALLLEVGTGALTWAGWRAWRERVGNGAIEAGDEGALDTADSTYEHS